jgi:uncharacterized protein
MIPALLVGWLGLVSQANALEPRVKDNAGFFSKEAIEKANKKITEIKRDFSKDLMIETFAEAADKEKVKENRAKYFAAWAKQRYEALDVQGIYVLMCKSPRRVEFYMGDRTKRKAFTPEDRKKAVAVLTTHLNKKPPDFDGGLLALVNDVDRTLERNIGRAPPSTSSKSSTAGKTAATPAKKSEGGLMSSIWGWICIGLVALLVLWLVIGLIRAFTGRGSRPTGGYPDRPGYAPQAGGYGPGGGYGGGGGGGGGGGFFSSLLGGMVGAGAGMYLYDTFFRSHPPSVPMGGGSSAYAGGTPASTSTPSDRSEGGDAGGADWGDDQGSAAGDTGGDDSGGGDWGGGGGDDTGGGDWGGGGGDDTGGGDWGGGTAESGGGDWGGGGDSGGGDW